MNIQWATADCLPKEEKQVEYMEHSPLCSGTLSNITSNPQTSLKNSRLRKNNEKRNRKFIIKKIEWKSQRNVRYSGNTPYEMVNRRVFHLFSYKSQSFLWNQSCHQCKNFSEFSKLVTELNRNEFANFSFQSWHAMAIIIRRKFFETLAKYWF